MTEPPPAVRRRLELLRHRRATAAADRAAFEARRKHGLIARHQAKLAHLAQRAAAEPDTTPDPEEAPPAPEHDAAA
ncbi:MAG TPA: hypothetical protein VGP26_11915 [Actinophytocola sp.]|nr:hypothetical protein [Actinophytocola sp.]